MEVDPRSALGAQPPLRKVEVDGVVLAMHDSGQGEAIVCLHAAGHGARDFEGLAAALSDRYRVIAIDLPGHGRSSADPRRPSYARYVQLLDGVLRALSLERVVLLGNSLGGGIALAYAAAHPEHVRGLVLCDPAGLVPVDLSIRWGTRLMAGFFACGRFGGAVYRFVFGVYYQLVLRTAAAAAQRARIVRASNALAGITATVWRTFGTAQADLRSCAERVRCPVLFAWAKRDLLVRLAASRPALARFPEAELVTFRGGHTPFLECPDALFPVLEGFLGRLETARSPDAARGSPGSPPTR